MSWEDIQNEFDIMNRMSCRLSDLIDLAITLLGGDK